MAGIDQPVEPRVEMVDPHTAQRWIELDPNRVEARQVIAAIYVRQDKIQEAYEVIRDRLPLPGVMGRICFHPWMPSLYPVP